MMAGNGASSAGIAGWILAEALSKMPQNRCPLFQPARRPSQGVDS